MRWWRRLVMPTRCSCSSRARYWVAGTNPAGVVAGSFSLRMLASHWPKSSYLSSAEVPSGRELMAKLFPVGHDLLPVALVRLPQMEFLGRRMASCGAEVRCFHQAVAVAVEVEYARTGDFETAAGVSSG